MWYRSWGQVRSIGQLLFGGNLGIASIMPGYWLKAVALALIESSSIVGELEKDVVVALTNRVI